MAEETKKEEKNESDLIKQIREEFEKQKQELIELHKKEIEEVKKQEEEKRIADIKALISGREKNSGDKEETEPEEEKSFLEMNIDSVRQMLNLKGGKK